MRYQSRKGKKGDRGNEVPFFKKTLHLLDRGSSSKDLLETLGWRERKQLSRGVGFKLKHRKECEKKLNERNVIQ